MRQLGGREIEWRAKVHRVGRCEVRGWRRAVQLDVAKEPLRWGATAWAVGCYCSLHGREALLLQRRTGAAGRRRFKRIHVRMPEAPEVFHVGLGLFELTFCRPSF